MPVVEVSYSRLQGMAGAPKTKIAEALPFLGLDIESEDGDSVRIEYSPNRPDYSTDVGIALGLQGLLGTKTGEVRLGVKNTARYSITARPGVSGVRPFVTGIAAVGGRVDDAMIRQLMAMQEDLHLGLGRRRARSSIGIHDLDCISFPLTYTVAGRDHSFVPLNSGEPSSVAEILEHTKVGQDYGRILGNSGRVPVILDSDSATVSLPPIINAAATTVTTKTKNLLVEVTGTGKRDIEGVLAIVAVALQGFGFSLESVKVSGAGNSTPKLQPRRASVKASLVQDTLGIDIGAARIASCLKKSRLGAYAKGGTIECAIPPYRLDIFGPMDLVEEAALGYGIQNLTPLVSPSQTVGGKSAFVEGLGAVDRAMVGLGYMEALNSCLTNPGTLYGMAGRKPGDPLSVMDSKSGEHTALRDLLLPGLLENLSRNIHAQYPQRLYETGSVFARGSPVSESTSLCAVTAHKDANFSEAKSALKSALKAVFGLDITTRTSSHPTLEQGRCASVVLGGDVVGVAGEVSSGVLENHKIRVPVAAFEVSLSGHLPQAPKPRERH